MASCSPASATRSSRSPAAASWCIRRRPLTRGSKPRAASRSWSPISPVAGLAAGKTAWNASPRPTRAARPSKRDRRSTWARCASCSCGCSPPRSRPMTCTGVPRWCSCRKRSWNAALAAPRSQPPTPTPVLVGPTGVGKTAVAVALAALTPLTVISADARQVYRGLDIGTAKPDPETLARVPHRGLDLVEPGERYSAGRFARDAAAWIAAARAAQRQPVVVGGTGLYIRALAEGLFREPPFDADRRAQLRQWSESLEGADLARWAGRLDPQFLSGGRQRAARAVEVALLTGHALSWWQREAREGATLSPWYIQLTLPREVLHRRLAARVDQMLAAGVVCEVQRQLPSRSSSDGPLLHR